MKKPFDKTLYEDNDQLGRRTVKKAFLLNYNYNLEDNENIFGPDLKAYQDGKFLGYVEVEIKQFWKDHRDFPAWNGCLHIPERKKHLLSYENSSAKVPIVFCVLSADLKAGYWIDGDDLSECHIVTKNTKYVDDDRFFEVPLTRMQHFLVEPISNERDNNESVES